MSNTTMHDAKENKKDEFYTRITDIEHELKYYKDHFKGKSVFLNCDDPEESNFWRFFGLNFDHYGLTKLTSTHYSTEGVSYKLEYDGKIVTKSVLKENGDFRSPESVAILKESDIVVTNPPFSLFREFIGQLIDYDKSFLVMGNNNTLSTALISKLILDEKLWLGVNCNKTTEFRIPDDYERFSRIVDGVKYGSVPAISWFTNMKHGRMNEEIQLYRDYNKDDYPTYDNYDAINVNKVNDIPCDYYGEMGVPITFLGRHNPTQFEVIGNVRYLIKDLTGKVKNGIVNGKEKYTRFIIKRVQKEDINGNN